MCGILGIISFAEGAVVERFLDTGNRIQQHRGPDAHGSYIHDFGRAKVGLGHQRLSILDLSDAGAQPMHSRDGRYTLVFNGEVYNYLELAREHGLKDLKSSSDTEVVLELLARLGPGKALATFNGMWALALLDRQERRVYLSRDRFGKKPLYYQSGGDGIRISSELKSLFQGPSASLSVNARVASRYLAQALQDVDEECWAEGVKSLPPGTWARIDIDNLEAGVKCITPYWQYPEFEEFTFPSFDSYVEELRALVIDAVRLRLRSDVPIGLALSGGLDSSIISGAIGQLLGEDADRVRCFSAVSPGSPNDESHFIDSISAFHGVKVDKVQLEVGNADALNLLLLKCSYSNDAPLGSFSNVLFYLLMERAASLGVKVVFSGQGADEAFCGYKKYPLFEIKRRLRSLQPISAAIFAAGFLARGTIFPQIRLSEAKRYLGRDNAGILGATAREVLRHEDISRMGEGTSARQRLDMEKYSVPYLTHYEDRMSMAWSREVRAPFLDFRVVEHGLRAPTDYKMRKGWTKYCLREAFKDLLPSDVTWRKDKQGFVNPQDDWLRGALRPAVEALIHDRQAPIFSLGLVDRNAYERLFVRYLAGDPAIWFRDVFAPFALAKWMEANQQEGVAIR
jgi:asparagine synthase (glutamine-hydrolysing)